MTTPSQNPDDSWAELYSELGLEPETAAPKSVAEEPPLEPEYEAEGDEPEETGGFADAADSSDEEGDGDGEADAESAEGEATEEGGDPTKKKRRRRRRRRGGKKEDGTDAGPAGEAGEEAEAEGDVAVATAGNEDEDGINPEATRELIANWDVPSWGEIVAGLFRPTGNHGR